MVARLPTEQEVVGSSPTSGFFSLGEERLILGSRVRPPRWAIVELLARLAQSVEHKTLIFSHRERRHDGVVNVID